MITAQPTIPEDLEALARRQPVVVKVLGPFQLFVNGQSVPNTSKTLQQVAGYLALRPGRGAFRAEIAQAIWPNASNERALFYLRRVLTQLRQALGQERNRLQSDELGRVVLDLEGGTCDVAEFERAVISPNIARKAEAARWYGGPFLVGHEADWVLNRRQSLIEQFVEGQEAVAEDANSRGDHRLAAVALQSLLREDPLNEHSVRQLMGHLASSGDPAGATRTYQEFRRRLKREIGLAPAPETELLHRRLVSEFALSPKVADPINTLIPTHRLPYPAGPLLGRAKEKTALESALGLHRAVTLVGVGGVGKTRLALAVAHDQEANFSRTLALNLREAGEEDVATTLCAAFGVAYESDAESLPRVGSLIGENRTLLYLDNAESAAKRCAGLVRALLSHCGGLTALTTSRVPLGVSGEYVMRLEPLAVALRPRLTKEMALESEAVQFFIRRAAEAKPGFEVTEENAGLVTELCERVDGLPFALELAAVQLRKMSLRSVLARLVDHTELLSSGETTNGAAISLETVMSWSYDLLSEKERRLFENLSIFPSVWSLGDAEAIADLGVIPSEISSTLGSLIDQSLVSNVGTDETDAYRFLDTVRSYALKQLQQRPDDLIELQLRHARRCAEKVEGACSEADFRAAVANCMAIGTDPSVSLAMVLIARRFPVWNRTFRLSEGLKLAVQLIGDAGNVKSDPMAELLFRSSGAAHVLSRFGLANNLLDRACAMADELGLDAWTTLSLLERGELAANQGYLARAKEHLEAAKGRYAEEGDRYGVARCVASMGYVLREEKDLQGARALTEEALASFVELGDTDHRLWCLGSLGAIHEQANEHEAAESRFLQTLALQEEAGNYWAQAWNLSMLAQVNLKQERFAAAAEYADRAIAIHRSETETSAAVWALTLLGRARLGLDDLDAAEAAFQEALDQQRETDALSKSEVNIYEGLAAIHEKRGNLDQASAFRRVAETKESQLAAVKTAPLT